MLSVEITSKLVLNRLMKNNEKALINSILSYVRCKHCKNLEEECCCPRCSGLCFKKIFEGCECSEICEKCLKQDSEKVTEKKGHILCENCDYTDNDFEKEYEELKAGQLW